MNPIYTTHLICAPQLELPTIIGAILAEPGDFVEADDPLVLLHAAGLAVEVCAPGTGIVGNFVVHIGEAIGSNDLLLTMEIEEEPFGFIPMTEEEASFAPACQLASAPAKQVQPSGNIEVTPEAAELSAKLGVNLSDIRADTNGVVDDEAVAAHVRDILIRWRKIQRLM